MHRTISSQENITYSIPRPADSGVPFPRENVRTDGVRYRHNENFSGG